ncbi:winged helix-turn-helix domain-containing protein [Devosia limi]|uniref:Transcriptional regulatory protein, C terminal n=1 Tax=Devosia limi DSM 17137 TaxID=1121477 RepID=A0A1M4XK35_9HYPH|nr:winged helix-turn-helix domain-containing protein [Devosia limi]SHE93781.1 Transcriptional regulatory protein, C terminal [Devosia limi DSM 17137]
MKTAILLEADEALRTQLCRALGVTGLIRRLHPPAHAIVSVVGDIELDRDARRVTRRGRRLHLTPGEFRLLETLARKPGEVFSREELLDAVSRQNTSSLRAVDVQVARLKLALTVGGRAPAIRTVRGRGYMIT